MATEGQKKCISYFLWQIEAPFKAGTEVFLNKELDFGTASDLIGAFKRGDKEIALNQLHHLRPDLF